MAIDDKHRVGVVLVRGICDHDHHKVIEISQKWTRRIWVDRLSRILFKVDKNGVF